MQLTAAVRRRFGMPSVDSTLPVSRDRRLLPPYSDSRGGPDAGLRLRRGRGDDAPGLGSGLCCAHMADEPPSHEPELQHFGKYLLDQELARGGMSRVFRARLRGPGGFEKRLVVKQVLPELARDPGFIELFVKEANTLVQMSHPNLVPVYELGVIDGVYFLAMEWVEGATISELLEAGPLAPALVAQLGLHISEAL